MNEISFDIGVDNDGELLPLTVEPRLENNTSTYDILQDGTLFFSITCCSDEVGDTLTLTDEFKNKGLNEQLVSKVIDIVMSEEE